MLNFYISRLLFMRDGYSGRLRKTGIRRPLLPIPDVMFLSDLEKFTAGHIANGTGVRDTALDSIPADRAHIDGCCGQVTTALDGFECFGV